MKFWAEIFCILVVAYLYVQIRNARRQSGRGNSNSRGSSNDDAGGLPLVGSSDDGASHHGSGTPTAAPAATLAEAAIVVAMAAAETAAVAAIDRRTPHATPAYPYSERAIISFMISFAPP